MKKRGTYKYIQFGGGVLGLTCVSQKVPVVVDDDPGVRVVEPVSTVIAALWDDPRRVQVSKLRLTCRETESSWTLNTQLQGLHI